MSKFAVVVESKKAVSGYGDTVLTEKGDKFLVVKDDEGWINATSTRLDKNFNENFELKDIPKLFDTKEKAIKFAKRWKGHPWWCIPNGKFEIFEVEEVYKTVEVYDCCKFKKVQ